MKQTIITISLIIILTLAGVGGYFYYNKKEQTPEVTKTIITTYQECVDNKGSLSGNFKEKCEKDGKGYYNRLTQEQIDYYVAKTAMETNPTFQLYKESTGETEFDYNLNISHEKDGWYRGVVAVFSKGNDIYPHIFDNVVYQIKDNNQLEVYLSHTDKLKAVINQIPEEVLSQDSYKYWINE